MSAQFFGRSGKVLYGAFSIVGMAYQSQNVNNGIPDDRVARSSLTRVWQSLLPLFCDKTFEFAIQTWQTSLEHYYVYVQTYFLSQLRKTLILLISSYCKMCTLPTLRSRVFVCCEQYKHARSYCWQWTHFTMGPNEQNQHFAELRQKICLHIYVVVLLTCLPSLDGKLERFVTKKWQM